MPGELSRTMTCQWTSEKTEVVLEIPDQDQNSKATSDSTRCSWAQLLHEMEENDVTDPGINCHELLTPLGTEGRDPSD